MMDKLTNKVVLSDQVIKIERIEVYALSVAVENGPVSSLGKLKTRNGLLVALTAKDGVTGWGEIWCNFPQRGALGRMNLLQDTIAERLLGLEFYEFDEVRPKLEADFSRMITHTGEYGPFNNCFAGIDTALADMAAKRHGQPLSQFLAADTASKIPAYASAPNVDDLEKSIGDLIQEGHTAAKLKIGFQPEKDIKLVDKFIKLASGRLDLLLDANQNWNVNDAISIMDKISNYPIGFLEEPLHAEAPLKDWAQLAQSISVPLAAGENISTRQKFINFIDQGGLEILQPDVAKYGGVSGAFTVGETAIKHEKRCFMHYMGTGLGLAASLHCLAAINGGGLMELDATPNPLRTELGTLDLTLTNGFLSIPDGHGHGFTPDPIALKEMTIESCEIN